MSFPSNLVLGVAIERKKKMCLSNHRVICRQKGAKKRRKNGKQNLSTNKLFTML